MVKEWGEITDKAATIEEALEKTHFGKFNIHLIFFGGLVLTNVMMETLGVSFALPVVACDLDLSYKQQGLLCAISFIGIIVSSHFWGLMADTRGRKHTMRPALLLGSVVTFLSSFSVNFYMMVVLRFLNGVFLSAVSATIYAYVGEFHSKKHSNRAMLLGTLLSEFSSTAFPAIVWLFINQEWSLNIPFLGIIYKPWRLFFAFCGVPAFVSALVFDYLPESPKFLLSVGRDKEALIVLKKMHEKNTKGNKKLHNEVFEIKALLPDFDTPLSKLQSADKEKTASAFLRIIWDQTAPLFMSQYIRKTCLAALLQFITFFTAHGVYMWFTYMLNNVIMYTDNYSEPKCLCDIMRFTQSSNFSMAQGNQDKICVSKLEISTYTHSIAIGALYTGFLMLTIYACKKFSRHLIISVILISCGICGILCVVLDNPLLATYMFVMLLCCGLVACVVSTIVVDIYPTNLRAMAVGISLMMGRTGSVVGANVLGSLIESHCEVALYSSAISIIIAGFLIFLLPKPHTQQMTEAEAPKDDINL